VSAREGRNRKPGADRDDDQGSEDERPTGPAFDKRDLVGAYDMDDQRLGEERSYEPAGVATFAELAENSGTTLFV